MVDLEGQLVVQLSAMSPYLKNCDFVYLEDARSLLHM
jgi:hypothetical protein